MPTSYYWFEGHFHICNHSLNISLHITLLVVFSVEVKKFPLDYIGTWNKKTLASVYILIEYILCVVCKFNDENRKKINEGTAKLQMFVSKQG